MKALKDYLKERKKKRESTLRKSSLKKNIFQCFVGIVTRSKGRKIYFEMGEHI